MTRTWAKFAAGKYIVFRDNTKEQVVEVTPERVTFIGAILEPLNAADNQCVDEDEDKVKVLEFDTEFYVLLDSRREFSEYGYDSESELFMAKHIPDRFLKTSVYKMPSDYMFASVSMNIDTDSDEIVYCDWDEDENPMDSFVEAHEMLYDRDSDVTIDEKISLNAMTDYQLKQYIKEMAYQMKRVNLLKIAQFVTDTMDDR